MSRARDAFHCTCGASGYGVADLASHRDMHVSRGDGHYVLERSEGLRRAEEALPTGASVVALLDPSSERSCAMRALILREPDGSLHVSGLASGPKDLHPAEYARLLESGAVTAVDKLAPGRGDRWCCLWVGEAFERQLRSLGGRVDVPEDVPTLTTQGGRGWLARAARVYSTTELFMLRSLRAILAGGPPDLAHLLRWTQPDHPLAMAATWHVDSAAGPAKAAASLEWYARLASDRGRPTTTEALAARLRDVVRFAREGYVLLDDDTWPRELVAPSDAAGAVIAWDEVDRSGS